jgi:hypothetical protein
MLLIFPDAVQPAANSLYLLLGIAVSALMLVQAYRSGYGRTAARTLSESIAATA